MVRLEPLMENSNKSQFSFFKVHTQYSICEGAARIEDLKEFCYKNKIKSIGISDTNNLCGALEFSVNLSKSGTQPIIGTQIIFNFKGNLGLLPLIAKNEKGYKKIIELSSKSYLDNNNLNIPHCNFDDLIANNDGIIVLSFAINCLFVATSARLFGKFVVNN